MLSFFHWSTTPLDRLRWNWFTSSNCSDRCTVHVDHTMWLFPYSEDTIEKAITWWSWISDLLMSAWVQLFVKFFTHCSWQVLTIPMFWVPIYNLRVILFPFCTLDLSHILGSNLGPFLFLWSFFFFSFLTIFFFSLF